ncbi:MAG: hypothetical protein JXA74_06445 [Anaerolineae bacterium]|nr:hypothetical protein [Anaerolineae bacterium]
MKGKSCLVQMVVLIVLIAVVGGLARRLLDGGPEAQQTPSASGNSLRQLLQVPVLGKVKEKLAPDSGTPTLPPLPEPEAEGIEGLVLEVSRPLMFPIPEARGLAATESFFYVSGNDPKAKTSTLYQVHRDSYTIAQMRTIEDSGHYQLGGLQLGSDLLWVPVVADASVTTSVILGIDPVTLEVQTRWVVPERIAAIAEGPDARLYGVNEGASLILAWSRAGEELRRAPLATGAAYRDMETARGSLLCAGIDSNGRSVLDVIDPATLSLLVRHHSDGVKPQEGPLAGAGFAVLEETLFFLPSGGEFPKVHAYVLTDGRDWASMVPSVLR